MVDLSIMLKSFLEQGMSASNVSRRGGMARGMGWSGEGGFYLGGGWRGEGDGVG